MTSPLWPEQYNFLPSAQKQQLPQSLQPALENWRQNNTLPKSILNSLVDIDLPMAAWLAKEIDEKGCRILGITGGQGAGKSTRTGLLAELLTRGFGKKVATFSIDDIYLTHSERQQLARDIHPLLATRGVPGTHDPLLGRYLLQQLRSADADDIVPLPVFDKAIDDRLPPELWRSVNGPIDLVIFEGWCVGAMPQPDAELLAPINELEKNDDSDGDWRRFVNDELSRAYIDLFAEIDILLLLQVPDMRQVFEWRLKQEEQLRERHQADSRSDKIMAEPELRRFIQHYERITRNILSEMPERADIVFKLNNLQQIAEITLNQKLVSTL